MRAGLECGSSCAVQYVTYHATYSTRHGLPEVCESCLHGEHAIRLKEGRQSDESELLAMEEQTPVKEDEYNDMEDYLIFVTDTQATLLKGSEGQGLHQEVRQTTGADVQLFPRLPSARDTNTVIVRGSRLQIQKAVRLIYQKTEAQTFWLKWVEAAFPDLDSRAYFVPPVYFNRVPMTRESVAGQDVRILPPEPGKTGNALVMIGLSAITGAKVQESDVRDDTAMQRVVVCLQTMFEDKKKALVGISQLRFGQYLGESCFAAAAAQLPKATNLPSALSRDWKQGDFDVLLIHPHHGFVVFEVKAFGDNLQKLSMSQQDIDKCIRKKLREAAGQLDKAEAMLSHLVSGIAPGLRITKVIALPNLFARQVQKAISQDSQLTQVLRQCLTTKSANIADLCLCCDQLSDPKTPLEVSKKVLKKLDSWWHRCVTDYGPDSQMTSAVYHILLARFCGPATTVTVPCTCPPRVCIKTLGQAVSHTGECYTAHAASRDAQDMEGGTGSKCFLRSASPPDLQVFLAIRRGEGVERLVTSSEGTTLVRHR
ncbi:uncharacterized protein LOC112563946 [Pomacea canaliculata]|uniref:uncharacterized protein LOC112563946 n=1 Tax=Pomacea canaliculata TaxID=400727 RepID=UPI000D73027D|nr:uncharacterized protein LOC112563946 [Pomacea canaliculata]